jgi:serine/threonine-protein kinase
MMAKRPEDRAKSAVELLSQLKRLGGSNSKISGHPLNKVEPIGDTVVDDALYQATIDDTSLSSDGEVEVAVQAEEFDFGALPPIDLADQSPSASTVAKLPSRPVSKPKSSAAKKSVSSQNSTDFPNQQLLLGVGLAVAVMALIAVVGFGFASFAKPLPQAPTPIKATEDGKNVYVFPGQ